MNVILSECDEFRRPMPKPGMPISNEEEKRFLGLVLIRGEQLISLSVEGEPEIYNSRIEFIILGTPQRGEHASYRDERAGSFGGSSRSSSREMPMYKSRY